MALSKGMINPRRCRSLHFIPPTMSEVGIVLLGADIPLTSQVGNFLLSRSAFETKVPLASEKLQHERARGHVEGRTITVVNTTHLYNPKLSQEELTQRVKECISLADPGPYVFLLVLQSKPISVEVQDRVRNTFENYSPLFRERSIMLITGEDHEFINEWDGRHNRLGNISKFDQQELLQLLRKIDAVLKETEGSDLQEKKHPRKCSRNQEQSTENRAKADKDTVRKKLEKNKVSENNLRIILLGKSLSDTSIVGNLILGRSAFETEDPPHSVGLQCEAFRGNVKGRYITIINAPYLFDTLTCHQLTLRIKECVSLAAPGPHVIMLVVQPESLTEKDITRVDNILSTLSEESHKYTMVLTTKNIESVAQDKKDIVQKIIAKANSNHLEFSTCSQIYLVEKMEEMVRENKGSLICEIYEDAKPAIWQPTEQIEYQLEHQETETTEKHIQTKTQGITLQAGFEKIIKMGVQLFKKHHSESKQIPHLKLVQLETGKVKDSSSKKTLESSSVCVEQKEVVSGHLITHLMMPALHSPQLSEQEVMHQIFHFVSASDSGVHAFFINVPEGPPTDETKAEIKMFQRIFGSRVNDHTIFIIQQQSSNTELDKDLQSMINTRGGRYHFCRSKFSLQTMFPSVEQLLKENNNRQYTMAMFVEAQLEEQLKYRHELITLQRQMTELKRSRSQTHDLSNNHEALRIVLLGKTGVGKSATGNTIMRKQVFKEILSAQSVSTVCQKEWVEIRGRKIAVIDTPGLFDTKTDNEAIRKEIVKCISMAAPGPHVFLLVLRPDRFTEEERNAMKMIENTFGKTSNQYTIILFTRGDDLYSQTIEEFLKTSGTALNTLLFSCGNRYHVFNNRDKSSNTQVLKLLDKIDTMVNVNGGSCYTNEMFQEVEEKLEKEKERILKEREEQIEREKKELETKHEAEMEKMRQEMQKQEAERREKEEQREKQIKREMAEMEEKLREDCRKRIEDDLKMEKWMEVINREREENRKQWEKQREEDQKRRDQEEQERRRREDLWKSQQMEEKQKVEREKEEMEKNKEKELEKLQKEYELRASEEDKRMKDLEEKIKNAEESKKKEPQELMLSQQREKKQRMKSEEEKTKEQQKNWGGKLAAMEERWRSEQLRKEEEYERKLQKEKEERDLKERERKQKEEEERRRIETDYTDKIKTMEEQLKEQREKYEKERMKKDEEHKKELEDKIQKQSEEFKKEKEENERKHNDEIEKNRAFVQEQHEKALKKLKEETEQEARKQAEEEFCASLDKKKK